MPVANLSRSRKNSARKTRRGTSKRPYGLEPLELRQLLTTYWVSTSGNDANAGTSAAPFKRIQIGASHLHAGDTLNIMAGNYTEGVILGWDDTGTYGLLNGTSAAHITIQADPAAAPGTVIISAQNNKTHDGIDLEPGNSWIDIKGITVTNGNGSITRDGIHVSGSDDCSVKNCTVTGVIRFGMFCSFTTNFLVQGNSVSNTVGNGSSDQGHGIYISNSDVNPTVRGNVIFNNTTQGLHLNGDISQGGTGMIDGALIEGNLIYGNGANGINGDGVENSRIQNNIIYNNGKHGIVIYQIDAAAGSTNNVIVNNTIYQPNSSGAAIQLVNGATNNVIYNNVLIGGRLGSFNISDDSKPGFVSDYNAVVDHFENDDSGATYTLASWRTAMSQDAHSFVGNASTLFVNAAGNDFHLKTGSAAINAGTTKTKAPPTYDFEGNSRPVGGAFDIGAYEFGSSTTDTTPPTLSSISAGSLTTTGATISWTSDESADSQVEYGTTTSYGSSTTLNASLVSSHSVVLSGLTGGTTYHYRVKSKDAAGNLTVSADFTFTTATPDTTPPTISSVTSGSLTTTGATITWTTNEAADTQVEYGTTTTYGNSTTLNTSLVTSHSQALTGLTGGTVYHYRVKSKDAAGNLTVSADFTFTTVTPDTTAPTASLTSASNITSSGATTYSFTVTFSDNIAIKVSTLGSTDIRVTGPNGFTQTATFVSVDTNTNGTPRVATYRINTPGGTWDTTDNGTYTIAMLASQVSDTSSNFVVAGTLGTFTVNIPDTTPPTLSAITSTGLTNSSGTVTWTSNEAADSQVEFGTTTSYGSSTTLNASMVTSHSVNVTGLQPGTLYHYRVKSKDAAGNLTTSADFTFTTATVDTSAPTASFSLSNVPAPGGNMYTFTVTFSDNAAIDVSTLGSTNFVVTGPNGFNQAATFLSVNINSNGAVRTATYAMNPPGGTWSLGDNGTYTVTLNANEVADTSGNFVAGGSNATFSVNIADTTAPTAQLATSNINTGGGLTYSFTVTYSDNVTIDASTIGSTNVRVTGPNGFSQVATLVAVNDSSNGSPRTATYQISCPGGYWDIGDNGTYTISMLASQVTDGAGNFVAAGALGAFTVSAPPNAAPTGYIDVAGPTTFSGWVADSDSGTTSLGVGLVVDGVYFTGQLANGTRNGLIPMFGSPNHGFSFDLSSLTPGLHKIDLYAADANNGISYLIGSRQVNTNLLPAGWVDVNNGTTVSGWAADGNAGANSSQVRIVIDGNAPVLATANRSRNDLISLLGSPNHGFSVTLPQLTAGAHTIAVYAIDSTTFDQVLIANSAVTVAGPIGNPLPIGYAEVISATAVSGWAMDTSSPTASINVRVDVDDVVGTPFLANLNRTDVSQALKVPGSFGFNKALSLAAGEHKVAVYAIDTTSGVATLLASKMVGAPAPLGSIDAANATMMAGWVYSPALSGVPSTIRIDVDGVAAVITVANKSRPDLIPFFGGANFGYRATLPPLMPGAHVLTLSVVDPLTLVRTILGTTTVVA